MTAGERYVARVRAWQRAFDQVTPGALWARLLARLAAARLVRFLRLDRTWLSVALADFEAQCDARIDQTTFEPDDPSGRSQAFREGKRQAYLYLARLLAVPQDEVVREALRLEQEEERAIDAEVRRRLSDAG